MNTNTNTNTNTLKRLKKFESEFRGVKSNPFYEKIKAMYTSGEMRMLPSVRNLFDKVKFNKTTKLVRAGAFKAIESVENKIIEKKIIENKKINQEIKAQLNKQIIAKSSVQNVLASNVYKTYETIVNNAFLNKHIDSTYTPFYNFYGFSKVANNNSSYYIQTVTYYDESNNKLSGEIIKNGEVLNVSPNIFQTSKVDKKFNNKIYFEMTPNEYQWTPRTFIKDFNINGSVRIITTAYNILIKNKISPSEIIQIYKDNDSGTCLYDGVFNYFVSKKDENPKYKTIYNRLISIEGLEYKRAYTDETIITLCNFIDSTIIIRDLINGADKVFKVDNARYTIEFLNTKINHLDRLVNSHNIKEVDTDTMTQLKTDSPFYIEKQGQLITPECSYKLADDDFQIVYKKWKKDIKYSSNFINKNDDEYHMISSYDYNMHRFFNDDMIVDDSLYKEIDLKKAYYNYSDKTHNKFYNGLPSGSFINVKINNNFTIDTFD